MTTLQPTIQSTPQTTSQSVNSITSTSVFHPDTPILLYNGTIKLAKDINLDDTLMGSDSLPIGISHVKPVISEMYKITPIKGDQFFVGKDHILSLQLSKNAFIAWRGDRNYHEVRWYDPKGVLNTKQFRVNAQTTKEESKEQAEKCRKELSKKYKDTIINISVKNYMEKNKTWKTFWKLYRTGVYYYDIDETKDLTIDPYLIGLWLGDGTSAQSEITNIDKEIIDYLEATLPEMDMNLKRKKTKTGDDTITYSMKGNGWRNNMFLKELQDTCMLNNKHIPDKYKYTSLENRLKLLAGLIDTDGYLSQDCCYEIIQKSSVLANDIAFVARSCGFATYPEKCKKGCWYKGEYREGEYNRMFISGDTITIPVLLTRKKAKKRKHIKDVLRTGLSVELSNTREELVRLVTIGQTCIMLGDFTVTGGSATCT